MVSKAPVSTQVKDQKKFNLLIHCCIKWDGSSHRKLGFKGLQSGKPEVEGAGHDQVHKNDR